MSRTHKDAPVWVRRHRTGQIDHNHQDGVCLVETLGHDRHTSLENRHARNPSACAKRTRVEYCCDYDDYNGCNRAALLFQPKPTSDKGHKCVRPHYYWGFRAGVPCECDADPNPTCYPTYDRTVVAWGDSPKSWYLNAVWHGPERVRERDQLRNAAREYNAYGEVDDFDFENPQARGMARWMWW